MKFHKEKKVTIISSTEGKIRSHDFDLNDKNITYKLDHQLLNLVSDEEVILSLIRYLKIFYYKYGLRLLFYQIWKINWINAKFL